MIKLFSLSQDNTKKIPIEYEWFKFSGGEIHFKIPFIKNPSPIHKIKIQASIHNSDDLMLLMLISDYFNNKPKYLELLYTPYARQDRKTTCEEPFSFKTFTKLINSCDFDSVTVYDPHSDVTPALINNINVVERINCLPIPSLPNNIIIVSPDAGAMKANQKVAQVFNCQHVVATKVRDVYTGEITDTQVHTGINLKGHSLMILDDICDGGRTFIELAKVLKTYEPRRLHLHITVGLFSKGIEVVQDHFDAVTYFYKKGE